MASWNDIPKKEPKEYLTTEEQVEFEQLQQVKRMLWQVLLFLFLCLSLPILVVVIQRLGAAHFGG